VTDGGAGYVHGYTDTEQRRLVSQSLFLEPWVYAGVDFAHERSVLEVGCGVGAQLAILLRRFPQLQVTGVDRSEAQIAAARQLLAADVAAGRADLRVEPGEQLGFAADRFDGAFLCWVLEHAAQPLALWRELRRVVRPDGRVLVTEVFNDSLFLLPQSAAFQSFWRAFNAYQRELGGDPSVGVRLGNLLTEAGFGRVRTWPVPIQLDRRVAGREERARFVRYWQELFQSAVPGLLAEKRVGAAVVEQMQRDLGGMADDLDAVFYVTAIQAEACV
jgi:SAM-dependent methyltransferase